jgi:predicted NAD/FAD-binding protein
VTTPPPHIGVIGSGVAGLTAAYVASRTAHVTLFEADDRLGGHADTHVVAAPEGDLRIDTGFIVHNRRTYPTLLRPLASSTPAPDSSAAATSTSSS